MINPKIRLPKNYLRFVGLVEQLFAEGHVPSVGEPLLSIEKISLSLLVGRLRPGKVLGLSSLGKPLLIRELAQYTSGLKDPLVLVGGFPRGHFTDRTRRLVNEMFRVDRRSLDAWVVAGRLVYDFEWSIGLAKNRLEPIDPVGNH